MKFGKVLEAKGRLTQPQTDKERHKSEPGARELRRINERKLKREKKK